MPGYISEIAYTGNRFADFVEVALPVGTDPAGYAITLYDSAGNVVVAPFALGTPSATEFGNDIYLIDNDAVAMPDIRSGYSVALTDGGGTVLQFSTFGDGGTVSPTTGPAAGKTSTNIGSAGNGSSLETTDDGATYTSQAAPNPGTIPCYAPGTMIDTPDGPRAVENLQAGDLVQTLDHGPKPIRWVRSGDHPLDTDELGAKPVLIAAGSMGSGRPAQDLIVSPQHRILVGGGGQLQRLFNEEAFAPAKSLTALRGIRHMKGKRDITWIHFACDRHEVVIANGCASEALLLGPIVVNGLKRSERRQLIAIFGEALMPGAALNGPAARACLNVGEVRRNLAKCRKEKWEAHSKRDRQIGYRSCDGTIRSRADT